MIPFYTFNVKLSFTLYRIRRYPSREEPSSAYCCIDNRNARFLKLVIRTSIFEPSIIGGIYRLQGNALVQIVDYIQSYNPDLCRG